MREAIEPGFMVFVVDGEEGIGSVREMDATREQLTIYIENAGDFVVPLAAVSTVHSQKVMLDRGRLDARVCSAIAHAHDAESAQNISHASVDDDLE